MKRRFDKLLLMTGFMVGCGGNDAAQNQPVLPPGPPQIEITAIVSTNGERYVDDYGGVVVDCSAGFTVELGPLATPTSLVNWTLRGPSQCGNTPQCGFVTLRLERDGDIVARSATAATNALLELPVDTDLDGAYSLTAELVSDDGEPFVIDDEVFFDQVDVGIDDTCNGGVGGQAGAGGSMGGAGGEAGTVEPAAGGQGGSSEGGASQGGAPQGGAPQGGASQGGAAGASLGGEGGAAPGGQGGETAAGMGGA